MKFNALQESTDEEYFAFTQWLIDQTYSQLKAVMGDTEKIKEVITAYLETGYSSHLSSGELVDYFCVSANEVLEDRDFTDEEIDMAVSLYDDVNPVIFEKYYGS